MRRVFVFLTAVVLVLGLAAPAVLAAEPGFAHTGTLLMAFNGDVTVPTGDAADGVFVTGGTATIRGNVETVVVLDGTAILEGAQVKSVFVTGGAVDHRCRDHRHRRRPDPRRHCHQGPGRDHRRDRGKPRQGPGRRRSDPRARDRPVHARASRS